MLSGITPMTRVGIRHLPLMCATNKKENLFLWLTPRMYKVGYQRAGFERMKALITCEGIA